MHGHATLIRPEAKKTAKWNNHAALTCGFIYEKKLATSLDRSEFGQIEKKGTLSINRSEFGQTEVALK